MKHRQTVARSCRLLAAGWVLVVLFGVASIALDCYRMGQVSKAATADVIIKPRIGNRYFQTGQWRADARTLVAAARWCFEPPPASGPGTNLSFGRGFATNTTTVSPG